jgi:hypothetical protein
MASLFAMSLSRLHRNAPAVAIAEIFSLLAPAFTRNELMFLPSLGFMFHVLIDDQQ